jgi:putative DNA primase/helicase
MSANERGGPVGTGHAPRNEQLDGFSGSEITPTNGDPQAALDSSVARRRRRYRPPGPANPERSPADAEPRPLSPADAKLSRAGDAQLPLAGAKLTWIPGKATPEDLYRAMRVEPVYDKDGQLLCNSLVADGKTIPHGAFAAEFQRLHKEAMGADRRRNGAIREGQEVKRQDEPPDDIVLISAANIEPKPVNWLWRNGLQCGVFNLLAGQSTVGKSTIALSLAATITSGGKWPDGQTVEQGRVVFWSGEDDIEDTLLPRFLAAGGEQSMMLFIGGVRQGERKRPFNPAADMPPLTRAVQRLKDVRLIVLDPVAVVVKGDSHRNTETRVGLQPFADLCMQTGACGLGDHHFTKSSAGGNPLDRVTGSLAFHALPRCVLVAARDQNGGRDARRALMRAKVSNGPDWGGFDYKLDQRPLDNWPDIEAQRVLWGNAIDGSARDILAQFEGKPETAVRKAATFLRDALKGGPRMAREVIAEGEAAGFGERQLQRALKAMGGTNERVGGIGKGVGYWIWELPSLAS